MCWFLLIRYWECETRGSIDTIRGVGFLRYLFSSRSIATQSWKNGRTNSVKRRIWLCISSKRSQPFSSSLDKSVYDRQMNGHKTLIHWQGKVLAICLVYSHVRLTHYSLSPHLSCGQTYIAFSHCRWDLSSDSPRFHCVPFKSMIMTFGLLDSTAFIAKLINSLTDLPVSSSFSYFDLERIKLSQECLCLPRIICSRSRQSCVHDRWVWWKDTQEHLRV